MSKVSETQERARQWPTCTLAHCGHVRSWESGGEARAAAGRAENRSMVRLDGSAACGCHGGVGTFTCDEVSR